MSSSDPRKATKDLLNDIKKTFKKYTRGAREKAWGAVTSKNGNHLVNRLARDPGTPVVGIPRLLSFKEWITNEATCSLGPNENQPNNKEHL